MFSKFCISLLAALLGSSTAAACERAGEMLDAIASNSTAALESILQSGESPNCKNLEGNTPLGLAAGNRNVLMIKILLRHKADVNQTDGGVSPLYWAALVNCTECADILISAGGKLIASRLQVEYLKKFEHVNNNPFWKNIVDNVDAK